MPFFQAGDSSTGCRFSLDRFRVTQVLPIANQAIGTADDDGEAVAPALRAALLDAGESELAEHFVLPQSKLEERSDWVSIDPEGGSYEELASSLSRH